MADHFATVRAVMRLAREEPEWLPVLEAACQAARGAERHNGAFDGARFVSDLEHITGRRIALPGLRALAGYGLIEQSGPSLMGGRMARYWMPDRIGVELALAEIQRRDLADDPGWA